MSRRDPNRHVVVMELIHSTTDARLATRRSKPSPSWIDRQLYPFAEHEFATPEGHIHYVDEGQGRPYLFVHGTPSWSFEWRHLLINLRHEARVVAPDHLGFGLSDKPPGAAYLPSDHARRLIAFVRALDLRDITLVLHDFGGPIGLPLVFEEASRIRSVVVLNSWMWSFGNEPRAAKLSRVVASPLGRFLYLWLNASPRWIVPASFARRAALSSAVHRHYIRPFGRRSDRVAPWTLGCELAGARSDAFYESLWTRRAALQSLPVSLVWGMRDPAFGPAILERWREALPAARVHELPEAGHFPQEEAPDQVLEAVREAGR